MFMPCSCQLVCFAGVLRAHRNSMEGLGSTSVLRAIKRVPINRLCKIVSDRLFSAHTCGSSVSPVCHQCVTSVSPMCHLCVTSVSPICHQCVTSVSPVCHQCVTSVSPVCTGVVVWCVFIVVWCICHVCYYFPVMLFVVMLSVNKI